MPAAHDRLFGWFTWMTTPWQAFAVAYVALEGVLGAIAFNPKVAGGGGPSSVEVTAFALLLPILVVALPVFYVVGAGAWSLTGPSLWLVTITFTLLFLGAATVNVLVLSEVARGVVRRRVNG